MRLEELHLELTRNCTIECEHCLRGDRQMAYMDLSILEEIFKHVEYVDGLVLTGGEPLLAIEALEKLAEILKNGRVKVRQIRIATNGTVFGKRIINVLKELNKYAVIKFRVSDNIFHRLEFDRLKLNEIRNKNLKIMRSLDLHWDYKEDYGKEECSDIKLSLVRRGRAANLTQERLAEINSLSPQKYVISDSLVRHPFTTIAFGSVRGYICIDVYGNIVNYSQSFDAEDKEASETKLNIMKMPFEDVVMEFIKKNHQGIEEYFKDPQKAINKEKQLLLK